jgi:pyruvate dehydrogenase E1 component
MEGESGPVIAVSDYMKLVPDQVARWVPNGLHPLGTDGFGRSDTRAALRRFFEVDAESVALAALHRLSRCGAVERETVARAREELGLAAGKPDPAAS